MKLGGRVVVWWTMWGGGDGFVGRKGEVGRLFGGVGVRGVRVEDMRILAIYIKLHVDLFTVLCILTCAFGVEHGGGGRGCGGFWLVRLEEELVMVLGECLGEDRRGKQTLRQEGIRCGHPV